MGWRTSIIRAFARKRMQKIRKEALHAEERQRALLPQLLQKAGKTRFGKDHHFGSIKTHEEYTHNVPLRDYEQLRAYFDAAVSGQSDILWPGRPTYFAKTSGTTSGTKYIPMTQASTPHHVRTARDSLFALIDRANTAEFFGGKMVYISGSPTLTDTNGVKTGRLSGIVNHQIPNWIKGNKLPSRAVNVIEDWEEKVAAMVEESHHQNVTLIGGIPPWVQMFYEGILEKTGARTIAEVFPNLSVFVYGGVNFAPYRSKLNSLVGKPLEVIETYPASEGFLAFQDNAENEGLLLNTNAGIFFEFVAPNEIWNEQPTRLTLSQVELHTNYAVVLTTNAGLWSYVIGDTVEFVSLRPYRIKVTGRIKHFISAFGEHVIAKEVDQAMVTASAALGLEINEFTVAPQVNPGTGLPYHEWFVASTSTIANPDELASLLDASIQDQNIYYKDLIAGQILRPAVVTVVQSHAFRSYMQKQGKLGGQNKVPRLSNDRKIVDQLETID